MSNYYSVNSTHSRLGVLFNVLTACAGIWKIKQSLDDTWRWYSGNSCSLLPSNNILYTLKYVMVGTVNLFNSITPPQQNIKVTVDTRDFLAEYFQKSACGYVKICSLIWDKIFNMFEFPFYLCKASRLACCKNILFVILRPLLSLITYLDFFIKRWYRKFPGLYTVISARNHIIPGAT